VRASLDANILVYAIDVDARGRHTEAAALVERAALADSLLTLQTLGEFFHVVTRKGKLDVPSAARAVRIWRRVFPLHAADGAALDGAIEAVHAHHLPFWDAMLWATVQRSGCELLLTEDFQDGGRLGSVMFVNPFDRANASLLDRALNPL
jgi:predicted nucleic acid-binding protein